MTMNHGEEIATVTCDAPECGKKIGTTSGSRLSHELSIRHWLNGSLSQWSTPLTGLSWDACSIEHAPAAMAQVVLTWAAEHPDAVGARFAQAPAGFEEMPSW